MAPFTWKLSFTLLIVFAVQSQKVTAVPQKYIIYPESRLSRHAVRQLDDDLVYLAGGDRRKVYAFQYNLAIPPVFWSAVLEEDRLSALKEHPLVRPEFQVRTDG